MWADFAFKLACTNSCKVFYEEGPSPIGSKSARNYQSLHFGTFSSFSNAYELQMTQIWCHWKEDQISYKPKEKN
jgi:hypothetical protein